MNSVHTTRRSIALNLNLNERITTMVNRTLPLAVLFVCSAFAAPLRAASDQSDGPTVERLLKAGWQIAGFTNTFDNRSALILFKHPTESYLVQCRTGLDVTRTPPVYANCYELR